MSKSSTLYHSCVEILDDEDERHGFSAAEVAARRVVVDVLMGQVLVQHEDWDEAKVHLTRALEACAAAAGQPPGTFLGRNHSSSLIGVPSAPVLKEKLARWGGGCFAPLAGCGSRGGAGEQDVAAPPGSVPSSSSLVVVGRGGKRRAMFRFPLAPEDPPFDANTVLADQARLASSLLRRIQELQFMLASKVAQLKAFSTNAAF